MKLTNYTVVAGKNGTKGMLDFNAELDILSIQDFKSMNPAFFFAGGSIMVPILLDLNSVTNVEKIVITLEEFAEIERIELSVKSSIGENFKKIASEFVDEKIIEFSLKETARFIKIVIYRGEWIKITPNFEVYGTILSDKEKNLTNEQYRIEWMKLPPKVDKYGQYLYEEWDKKIHTDDDFKLRYEEEIEYLKAGESSKYTRDEYGGIIDGKNYGATGFFRTQKIDGKWWFITPNGNKFILKGTEAANVFEGPGLSRIHYKATDIVRSVYEELPDKNEYPEVYCEFGSDKGASVSLLLTNIIKKYGKDKYLEIWRDITMKRLKKWNFNAHAKWTKEVGIKLPYICSTGLNSNFAVILYAADPYDENFEKNVYEAINEKVLATRNDPLLIGYHFTNESGWTHSLVRAILESNEKVAAKKAFVEYILEKYTLEELSNKIDKQIDSIEELEKNPLKIEFFDGKEIDDFIFRSSVKFHKTVQKVFKDLAPNHLYMGGGLPGSNWRNSVPWTEGSAEYCDIITFDRYSREKTDYLKPYLHIDKPIANIEWSFITNQRGYNGGALTRILCQNQHERAELYKETIIEHMKLPQVVGMGWFLHYDQPLTGRALENSENAECYNFGLVDMQDTPYYEFVDKITLVNDEMEKMHEQGDNYTP